MKRRHQSKLNHVETIRTRRRFRIVNASLVAALISVSYWGYHTSQAAPDPSHHAACIYNQASKNPVQTNETFTATVKMYNNGSSTWGPQYGVGLNEYPPGNVWNSTGGRMSYDVPPGGTAVFNLTVHAPSSPGTYSFNWEMEIVFMGYFPDPCTGGLITVNAPPPPADNDHDGVPNTSDSCPNQAGPASNHGCPVSQPQPKPQPKPSPNPSPVPAPSPSGPSADTQNPTDPTDASAKFENGEVVLSWKASTDNLVGLTYQVERSVDNSVWEVLSNQVSDTVYRDRTTAFKLKYYYRVKAVDAAGNSSGYATAEITTPEFKANITDDNTVIESEDKLVQIIIPKAAVDGSVSCTVSINSDNRSKIPANLFVNAGPYLLFCQKENGDEIASFKQPVTVRATVPKDATKDYTKFKVLSFKDKWTQVKTKYAKKTRQFSFTTNEPLQFVVVGEKRKGIAGIVSVLLLLILGGGGFFFYRLRRAQQQSYDDYLRKKYYDL